MLSSESVDASNQLVCSALSALDQSPDDSFSSSFPPSPWHLLDSSASSHASAAFAFPSFSSGTLLLLLVRVPVRLHDELHGPGALGQDPPQGGVQLPLLPPLLLGLPPLLPEQLPERRRRLRSGPQHPHCTGIITIFKSRLQLCDGE